MTSRVRQTLLATFTLALARTALAQGATPVQGDQIVNVATLSSAELPAPVDSAPAVVSVRIPAPATIQILRYAPAAPGAAAVPVVLGAYRTGPAAGDPFAPLPAPWPAGAPSPLAVPADLPLLVTDRLHQGDPVFVRVEDADRNMDRTARETITVTLVDDLTGDVEVIVLTETGPDTGVFVGYVPTARAASGMANDGVLQVVEESRVTASYVDPVDPADAISTAGLVDPFGLVFDAATGQPVNGAQITIVDAATGLPATVLSDDGVTSFPSTVTSGGTATDGGGRVHVFPPGEYRFPFVAPGTYRLDVGPPAGYTAPSQATDAALQALPGAPFALVTPGSRGEPFPLLDGPAIRIDIPLDPASGGLWVRKTASAARVGLGDFLTYEIAVTNLDPAAAAAGVTAVDTLPPGFRYRTGSARVNGAPAPDPAVSADGRVLTFALGDLGPSATATIRLTVQVGAAARPGAEAVNRASARSATGTASNVATATVRVGDDLLGSRTFILGRVTAGECLERDGVGERGVAGVGVFLEDGTFAITDADGLFHFEGVRAGLHVVQLDVASLPEGVEPVACTRNDRFAGRAFSQFVEVGGGTLWRADFHLRTKPAAAPPAEPPPAAPPPEAAPEPPAAPPAVPLPPPPGEAPRGQASVSLTHRVADRLGVEYRAAMRGMHAPLTGARLVVTLPDGVDYEAGTSARDGAPIPDPAVEGRTLTWPLGDLPAEWSKVVTFRARAKEGMKAGEHAAIASVSGSGPGGWSVEAPPAETALRVVTEEVRGPLKFVTRPHFPSFGTRLDGRDRAELARIAAKLRRIRPKHLVVVGHTDAQPIAERSRRVYADNAALSLARAESVRAYLMAALGMKAEQVDVEGKGESEPIADNATARGRGLNRRVEVLIHEPETVEVATLVQPPPPATGATAGDGAAPAPAVAVETSATPLPAPAPPPESASAPGTATVQTAGTATAPAAGAPTAFAPAAPSAVPGAPAPTAAPAEADGFASPADGDLAPDRVAAVQVRMPSHLTPALAVDGVEVPADRIGYRRVEPSTGKTIYTYVGVDLGEKGSHTLTLTGKDPFGNVRMSRSATVLRTGEIASIRLVSAEGNVADGRTPVKVRLELRDASGDPIRGATRLELRGGTLRAFRRDGESLVLEDAAASRVVSMDKDGWVLFAPVTASGSHRALLACGGATVEAETWARPELRDWILVGLAEGTAGYDAVSGNMESLDAAGGEEELHADGRVAFYAKGRVRGSWLLTVAYDSDRPRPGHGDGLFQAIDPQTYFTLYGDGSEQKRDAPSVRKIYVKLEREQFYALFGDHDTGLTVTELSRYVRKLNGVRTELRTRHVEVNAFATRTDQIHARDEIPGDGTSGLYRLSRGDITPNSETVTLLTRDRFRSEVVVEERILTRFVDYSVDFDRGTLFFREPVPSRDLQFNPVTIVVEYEAKATSGEDTTLGGRAGVRLLEDRLRAGVTAIHEGQGEVQKDLYGADVRLDLGAHTRLRGEFALTDERGPGTDGGASAWLAEVAHATRTLEARAYLRVQETGFGLGQQPFSEAGTRKLGFEARYRFSDHLSLAGQAYEQDTFATGAERLLAETKLGWTSAAWSGHVGLLHASDRLADGSQHDSGQIQVGGKLLTMNRRLQLGADWSQSVWGDGNADFPTRVALRAEYKLTPAVAVTAAEELTWGEAAATQTTRLGLRSTLWKGGSLTSSIARDLREDASRVFGNVGLRQTLQLSDAWRVDAGAERSETVQRDGWYTPNPAVPPAHGASGEDFTALSVGAGYQVKHLVWDSRAELRLGEQERKWSILTGVVAERQGGWGFSGRGQLLGTLAEDGERTTAANLRFGLVYRPPRTRWLVLNRLDWILEDGVPRVGGVPAGDLARPDSWRIVDNLLVNHRPRKDLQLSIGYGGKLVRERIAGEVQQAYTDQGSLEVRCDLTPRWDLGLRGSLLHVWSARQFSFSGGPSLGYSPATNLWIGVGFNASGYEDRDFSAASYTAYGPWIRMRLKFDQESVREAASWLNRQ
ncbi:MAG TPA: OmpA family protein [Anaeromyxobacteraceae bacterium]|nr:OmpA family protein [Anaeromyxobacteraceae bacterium]